MAYKEVVIKGDSLGACPHRKQGVIAFPGTSFGKREICFLNAEDIERDTLIVGGIGVGKTNAFKYIVSQLKPKMTADDVMLIFDSKGDFRQFYTKGDRIISNSKTAIKEGIAEWNIYMDIVMDGWGKEEISHNANEISELIFYDEINNSHAPFFPQAAKDIFAAILKAITFLGIDNMDHRVKYMNNQALMKYLNKIDAEMLNDFLGKYEETRGVLKYIGKGNSEQALGVLAELQSVTSKLFLKNFGKDGRFSVRKFENDRNAKTLFVEYDISSGYSLRPIYRVLVDMFIKHALSNESKGNVYIICDEMKLLPHLLHMEDALNYGRSLGLRVFAGLQSLEQLYEVYTETNAKNLISAFQTVICFRTNNMETRKYISNLYGTHIISRQFIDVSNKVISESQIENVVDDWDITGLDKGEAIIGLPYEKPFVFKFERFGG